MTGLKLPGQNGAVAMPGFIPVNRPSLNGNERRYLNECIDSGWVSSGGPFVERFETEMARMVGRRHGVAVSNGSAALEAALVALDIGPGDEVIVPTFTIVSCVAAVVRTGATPVVVDCDPQTWNMTPERVLAAVTTRTRAIMVVHIYGLPVDMDPVIGIARAHGLLIVEDAAQAQGLNYENRPCGSFGDISTFSFYANKNITTGEGGMILTDDASLAERCRSLRNLCFKEPRFVHDELGWNLRLSNIQAAVGLAQLERLPAILERKRSMGRQYNRLLASLPFLQLPLHRTAYAENAYWVFGVVLESTVPFDAAEAMERLRRVGVGSRPFFWPMHEQPVFLRMGLFRGERHPVAELISRRGLYLPSGLGLSDEQQERVCDSVRNLLA